MRWPFLLFLAASWQQLSLSLDCEFPLLPSNPSFTPPFQDKNYLDLSTIRPAQKVQSVYTASETSSSGLLQGDAIRKVGVMISAVNERALADFRIAIRQVSTFPSLTTWGTSHNTFNINLSELAGDVVFGPQSLPTGTLTAGSYFYFTLEKTVTYDSSKILMVELSHDNGDATYVNDDGAPSIKYTGSSGTRSAFAYTYFCSSGSNWCDWGGYPFANVADGGCCPSTDAGKSVEAKGVSYVLDISLYIARDATECLRSLLHQPLR